MRSRATINQKSPFAVGDELHTYCTVLYTCVCIEMCFMVRLHGIAQYSRGTVNSDYS